MGRRMNLESTIGVFESVCSFPRKDVNDIRGGADPSQV